MDTSVRGLGPWRQTLAVFSLAVGRERKSLPLDFIEPPHREVMTRQSDAA